MSEFNLEEKAKEIKKYFDAKEDLKNLNKLYIQILDLNFNDKNLDILKDELSSRIAKEIAEKQNKENISTKEGVEILEDVKEELKQDKILNRLAENQIDRMFEIYDNYEIVDNLVDFGFDKNFIINCFSDEYQQLEASRNYSLITNEPFLYEDKNLEIYITKDDIDFVYGEKAIDLSEAKLKDLAKDIATAYTLEKKNYEYGSTLSEFISEYIPESESEAEEEEM